MSIPQDSVNNARLIRFEYGSIAEISSSSTFPTPNYLALVFKKREQEIREVFPVRIQNSKPFDLEYLKYIGKIVEKKEDDSSKITYHFTDGTWISIG
jgi:hypothetical protein